jgi:inhibitor of KinA sporulation pathway (predicted exonuclease)
VQFEETVGKFLHSSRLSIISHNHIVLLRSPSCKGTFRSACPAVTDEDAVKIMNSMIPDFIIRTGHHSPDEHPLAGCDHLADTKTLNASKNHYHKTSTDFGFAVK